MGGLIWRQRGAEWEHKSTRALEMAPDAGIIAAGS